MPVVLCNSSSGQWQSYSRTPPSSGAWEGASPGGRSCDPCLWWVTPRRLHFSLHCMLNICSITFILQGCLLHAREPRVGLLSCLNLWTAHQCRRLLELDLNPNIPNFWSFLFMSSKARASDTNNWIQTEICVWILPKFKADFSHRIQSVPISST